MNTYATANLIGMRLNRASVFCFVLLIGTMVIAGQVRAAENSSSKTSIAPNFPFAASAFLAQELPLMEAAVNAKDRSYFTGGLDRTKSFIHTWSTKTPMVLDTYPACTEAVSNFLIAGLCRISPPGSICEPQTFLPKVAANISKCNELAELTQSLR